MSVTYEIVLAAPPCKVVREEYFDTPHYPEIGIAYVAGYLESQDGTKARLIDTRLERLNHTQAARRILDHRPRIVGLTAFTHMITSAALLAEIIKAEAPETIVVIGGYHATFLPEETLSEFPAFDYLVAGEGEVAFYHLVTALRRGERHPTIPGVYWRRNDAIVGSGRGDIPAHLDELGLPAWHLYDPEVIVQFVTMLPIMSQRGCPFSCNFCSRPYGQDVRRRSPSMVVDEMERNIRDWKMRSMQFYDETFTVNKGHVIDICEGVIERKLDVEWSATVHANTVNVEVVRLMKAAGCTRVSYGVESGDDAILASMQKSVTKKRIIEAARVFQEAQMPFSALFIFGHPNETLKTIWASIRFAAQLKPTTMSFGIMVPYPGTLVWEMATKGEGGYITLSPNWDDYNKFLGNAVELRHVSRQALELAQISGYLYVLIRTGNFRELVRILVKERKRAGFVFLSMLRKLFRKPIST